MYAVIKTGGKQYRVSTGDKLKVESLNAAEGQDVQIDDVLMIGNLAGSDDNGEKGNKNKDVIVGSPLINNASVTARILEHGRRNKVNIVKFRRRKHHRKQMGHRQNYTHIEITNINAG